MSDELRQGPSGPPVSLDTNAIINDSAIAGATLTDVLDELSESVAAGSIAEATGSEPGSPTLPGYLSRTVIVNGTVWSLPSHVPAGNWLDFIANGSGAGGPSGRQFLALANFTPTTGAGGGARRRRRFSRREILDALPITFTVPTGGLGGVHGTVAGNPIPGQDGAACFMSSASKGVLLVAYGGGFGGVNATATSSLGGPGGGWRSGGVGTLGATATAGGAPSAASTEGSGGGGAGNSGTGTLNGLPATGGGGASGAQAGGVANRNGNAGGCADEGGGGGGGGAGLHTGGQGGDGGYSGCRSDGAATGFGGLGGTSGAAGSAIDGQKGPDQLNDESSGMGGGGGGCGTSLSQKGGKGGDGGYPGGGGAGGGCGAGPDGTNWTGDGGKGGDAQMVCLASL